MSTNLKYRERERQKKDKEGNRPEKLNEKKSDRQLERAIKGQTRHFLLEEQHKNFVAAVGNWEMLAKMSASDKK